jgi:pumilio family protein 6
MLLKLVSPYPSSDSENPHPVDLPHMSRMYKALLQGGHYDHSSNELSRSAMFSASTFASSFIKSVGQDIIVSIANGDGTFVEAEPCERIGQEGSEAAEKTLKSWFTRTQTRRCEGEECTIGETGYATTT